MWSVNGKELRMAEGDFGIELPFSVSGVTFSESDVLKFTFKKKVNDAVILVKEYVPTENKANLVFTEDETALFPVGSYVYSLDWYQSGNFMCNIIAVSSFKVVDKA